MSTVDPVPAEIRERIERAREARNVAVHAAASADYVAYLRAVTAAERELAAAYKAAYEHTTAGTALSFALDDAAREITHRAYENEADAAQVEHRAAGERA